MECKKCKFFIVIEGKGVGIVGTCRRYPPTQDGGGIHTVDLFPTVRNEMWCGEYKRRAKK